MKARRGGGAGRVPRGRRARARRRRGGRRGGRRGAREPRRAGGAARTCAPTRRSSPSRPSCEVVVAHKGFVWARGRGDRPRGARLAPAPRRGRDRQGGADPDRARRAGRRARRARAPAARPRLGARLAHRRAAAELSSYPARCVDRRSSGGRCPARRAAPSRRARGAARALPRGDPALVAAQRTLLVARAVRDRCRARSWSRPCRDAARACSGAPPPIDGRELLGRRRVHRRCRHPDRDVRAGRRGRPRDRGVGEPASTAAVARTLVGVARAAVRDEGPRQRRAAAGGGAGARRRGAAPSTARCPATRRRRCATSPAGRRARPRRGG